MSRSQGAAPSAPLPGATGARGDGRRAASGRPCVVGRCYERRVCVGVAGDVCWPGGQPIDPLTRADSAAAAAAAAAGGVQADLSRWSEPGGRVDTCLPGLSGHGQRIFTVRGVSTSPGSPAVRRRRLGLAVCWSGGDGSGGSLPGWGMVVNEVM